MIKDTRGWLHKRIVGLIGGSHSPTLREIWKYEDNRALIIAGLVWFVFLGFAIYGFYCAMLGVLR